MLDGDFGRPARERIGKGGNKGIDFAALVDHVDHIAAIGAQHVALIGNPDAGDFLAQAVHCLGCNRAPCRILPLAPDRADVIVAFAHLFDQLGDFFRRILQVRVQRHDNIGAGGLETGQDRHVLAVVAVQQHNPGHIGPGAKLIGQDGGGIVAAAVVDEDDLIRRVQVVERGIEARKQIRQCSRFVVNGDDDGNLRLHRFSALSMKMELTDSTTRSTSSFCIVANIGNVTIWRPTRSATGNMFSLKPRLRYS